MRKIIILFVFVLCSCARYSEEDIINMSINKYIGEENESTINSYVKIGEMTNLDILKKYNIPSYKLVYEDGEFIYIYCSGLSQGTIPVYESWGFSKVDIRENKRKIFSFKFDNTGRLKKFDYIKDGFGLEENYAGIEHKGGGTVSDITKYLDSVALGTLKGTIFRQIGKPYFSKVIGKTEYWQCVDRTSAHSQFPIKIQNREYRFLKFNMGIKVWEFEFQNGKLSKKKSFILTSISNDEHEFIKKFWGEK